jgi:chorismate mutase
MSVDPELERLRAAMDAVNSRLVAVLHERARLCRAIGAWKRAHGVAAVDAAREAEMLSALLRDAPADGFGRDDLRAILHAVFAASRRIVAGDRG